MRFRPKMRQNTLANLLVIKEKYSLAADGVYCEPFSNLNSLLTGKNTGNFPFSLECSSREFALSA